MAADDWYRSEVWNSDVEAGFRQRLKRARDMSQYLRIQASCLAESYPDAALGLLDEYFALGEHFDFAQAHVDRARAFSASGDIEAALSSYEAALERERQFAPLKTQAYLDFACLVVEAGIGGLYDRALQILDAHRDRPIFPADRYRAHGARALILEQRGHLEEARAAANLAMEAACETRSGFAHHPHLGLVEGIDDGFGRRVAALAA